MSKPKDPIIEIPEQPIEGQTILPGFEAPIPDAEAIDKAARTISFEMDFIRSPEDTLAAWGAPSDFFSGYLQNRFEYLVQKTAEALDADPEEIRDRHRRTIQQQAKLTEIAGQEQLQRLETFLQSRYSDALTALFDVHIPEPGVIFSEGFEEDVIKEQAVIYFFAIHRGIKPYEAGTLTPEQHAEIAEIYKKLDLFYKQKAIEQGDNIKYGDTLSEFIRQENPVKSIADLILKQIPLLQSISPTAHTMPNNPLMNALQQQPAINAGPFDLTVANAKGRRKEITAFAIATYDPGETGIAITNANLTEYERQVSDATVSLWIEASKEKLPPVFTPDMIYRAMPGGGEKASPQQRGAITRTIEKFRRLHITLDATEEMRKRGVIGPTAKYTLDNFYLNVTRAEYRAKNGGQVVSAYRIESEPLILTYSKMTNQLLTVPAKYLAIEKMKEHLGTKKLTPSGELVTMTAERQAMTGYMLRRIAVMKHDRRNKNPTQSNVILFDTLFREAGTATEDRKQTMYNRKFCFEVLQFWTASGYIKGYETQSKGRSITGVKILF